VVLLKGQVRDAGTKAPLEAFVQLYDTERKKLHQFKRTLSKDGSFELYIAGGRVYDFSVATLSGNYTFYAETMDLRELTSSTRQNLQVDLQPIGSKVSFELNALEFENDSTLSELASFELQRLFKMLKRNPDKAIEIAVHRETYQEDTTLLATEPVQEILKDDALLDSASMDSLNYQLPPPPPDATELKAKAIAEYLLRKGVPAHLVEAKGYADQEPIAPNDTPENKLLNNRIEVRFR
jgi:outer membrane protein OmpA-like peptidoglycan-associated protein